MQRITLICVGTLKSPWVLDGISQYTVRIKNEAQFEIVELPASKESDPNKQKEDESKRLAEAISKRSGQVWILDETGKSMTSEKFSEAVSNARDLGSEMIFVIGGAYGLSDEIKSSGDHILKLSDMTLPHELCRVVFLEALYRALQIEKGTGYHH